MPTETTKPSVEPRYGMKRDDPGDQPDEEAEIDAEQHEAGGVEGAERQADQRLAANEAGEHPVDLVREHPDLLDIVARQPAVDEVDHPVPVVEEIEGDDRRHDEEREDVDDREAAAPQRR